MIIKNKTVFVYDVEVFPNFFSVAVKNTESGNIRTFQISDWQNDIEAIVKLFLNKNIYWAGYLKFKNFKILKDVPISSDSNSKSGELLENLEIDNQQPSLSLTTKEGSETNIWNLNEEYNSDTSTRHLEIDDDIVRTIQ